MGEDARWEDRDKYPIKFEIDELRCIYCGMCEEACPVDAIELTSIYELTGQTRQELVYDREKLLEIYDLTKDNPKDPVRTTRGILGPASEIIGPIRRPAGKPEQSSTPIPHEQINVS